MIYQPIEPIEGDSAQVEAISSMQHLNGEMSDDEFMELLRLAVEWAKETRMRVHYAIKNGRMITNEQ